MNLRVLHITDFHVEAPNGVDENLRVAHYKPFLNGMCEALRQRSLSNVDLVIASGDFIHKGDVQHFEHCDKVLSHLAEELGVKKERIITSIGNHDYLRDAHTKDAKSAREAYRSFAQAYGPGNTLAKGDYYALYQFKDPEVYVLDLDSTWFNTPDGNPGTIPIAQLDRLYTIVEDSVPTTAPLLVVSHYPMDMPRKASFVMEEAGWPEKHLWKSAHGLLTKLNALRNRGALTAYFHGDGHSPDFWSYRKQQHAFLTSMIGGRHRLIKRMEDGSTTAVNKVTEVKVLDFADDGSCSIFSVGYQNHGFDPDLNTGQWSVNESGPRFIQSTAVTEAEAPEKDESEKPRIFPDATTEVISESIEDEIVREVGNPNKKLYAFGRYITSERYSSLGWVDIDSLMNNRNIFARCVEKSKEWLRGLKPEVDFANTIFIGLDFWGSCLAAQVSVITGVRNYCVAMKAKGRYNVELEKLSTVLSGLNGGRTNIVLFSDVVSTGLSIRSVADEIAEQDKTGAFTLHSISVISDLSQERSVTFDCFKSVGTFCSKLRLTVVENDKLPGAEFLPPTLDIR